MFHRFSQSRRANARRKLAVEALEDRRLLNGDSGTFEGPESPRIEVVSSVAPDSDFGTDATSLISSAIRPTTIAISVEASNAWEFEEHVTFEIRLSESSESALILSASTHDVTAISGRDYVGFANRVITFSPGELTKHIHVAILTNDTVDGDLVFEVSVKPIDSGGVSLITPPNPLPVPIDASYRSEPPVYSPDGRYFIYRTDDGLFAFDTANITTVDYQQFLDANWVVTDFTIHPNSRKIAATIEVTGEPYAQLVTFSIDGSVPVRMDRLPRATDPEPDPSETLRPARPRYTPDGKHLLFELVANRRETVQIFSIAVDSDRVSALVPLIGLQTTPSPWVDLYPGRRRPFLHDFNDVHLIYGATSHVDRGTLYQVPVSGGVSVALNGIAAAGGRSVAAEAKITPDGNSVIYSDPRVGGGLFRVPIEGGPIKLISPRLNEQQEVNQWQIGAENDYVIFSIGETDSVPPERTLYSHHLDTQKITELADIESWHWLFSDTTQQILFPNRKSIALDTPTKTRTHYTRIFVSSVHASGGGATQISGDYSLNYQSIFLAMSRDGQRAVFAGIHGDEFKINWTNFTPRTLVSVDLENGTHLALNDRDSFPLYGSRYNTQLSEDSRHVYQFTQENLFRLNLSGGPVTQLTRGLEGPLRKLHESPHGNHLLFQLERNSSTSLASLFQSSSLTSAASVIRDDDQALEMTELSALDQMSQETFMWRMGIPSIRGGVAYATLVTEKDMGGELLVRTNSAAQNLIHHEDVNNDGVITATDALLIINALNSRAHAEESLATYPQDSKSFHDVNGDNSVTALDALLVINQLNRSVDSKKADQEPNSGARALESLAVNTYDSHKTSHDHEVLVLTPQSSLDFVLTHTNFQNLPVPPLNTTSVKLLSEDRTD